MQYVAVIPPKKYTGISFSGFDMADAGHRNQLWFARVELFFRCAFKNRNGRTFQLDLALLSCLYNFNCPAAQTILQADGGARPRHEVANSIANQPYPGDSWAGCHS